MHAALVLPPGTSAGAAYARRLAAALRTLGHGAELIETTDPASVLAGLSADTHPVLDGMCLPDLTALPSPHGLERAAAVLFHRPGARDAAAERAALPRLGRVIASSEAAASRLAEEFGLDRAGIAVIEPGAADLPRSSVPSDSGGDGAPCRLLAVGAITARKGYGALLRALARLHDLDWTLTIAGDARRDPAYPAALLAQAEESGIGVRLRLVPDPDDATLDALWRDAHLFALATEWEGYPAAVAEALRRGLPVAATTQVGRLVPQSAGILAPPGEVDTLSKGLRRMIFDRALRAAMADAAWQAGQRLPSWADQARRFADALTAATATAIASTMRAEG